MLTDGLLKSVGEERDKLSEVLMRQKTCVSRSSLLLETCPIKMRKVESQVESH